MGKHFDETEYSLGDHELIGGHCDLTLLRIGSSGVNRDFQMKKIRVKYGKDDNVLSTVKFHEYLVKSRSILAKMCPCNTTLYIDMTKIARRRRKAC